MHINDLSAWCKIDFSTTISNPVYYAKNLFLNGTEIGEVTIPDDITEIKKYTFYNCRNLTKVTIPNSVTSIGSGAFNGCSGLISIELPNSITSIEEWAFYLCSSLISIEIPNGITSIGKWTFSGCKSLKSIKIPNSVTSIGETAFTSCSSLTSIEIPNSVTSIGKEAFYNCSGLTSIKISNSVTSIGNGIFMSCTSLTSIEIPNSVTSIGYAAFFGCSSLTSITIPNSVTSIGSSAFYGCSSLTSIISEIPANKLFVPESSAFSDVDKTNCTLYVPVGTAATYAATNGWKDFKKIVEFKSSYTITYKVDGEIYATDSIKFGATIVPIEAPTKEGHTFSGWSEIPETMPANDVVIEGSFSVNSYLLTYKVDGEVYETITVEYGATITPITEPSKEGHTFSGWSEIPATMPANDIVIEGSFSINSYTVTYKVDSEIYATDSIKYGATIEPIEAPTKEGHTFSGWSEIPETMPANDVVIEGIFSINSYTLTYKVDGEIYATDSIKYGATIVPIEAPTKEGHTFSGWSEIPETMPANDIIIEGSFSINTYNITYKVDGEIYATDSIKYGATIEPIEAPTKEGHTFSGWSEIPETMPAKDVVVEGTFSINCYTVTFMVDGEIYETMTVEYGAEIELPTPPEKEGYIFTGWIGVPATMPAEDIVIEGRFEVDTTGINAVILDLEKNEVYNLKGQRITESENLTRGIYIVNGKKVYIK